MLQSHERTEHEEKQRSENSSSIDSIPIPKLRRPDSEIITTDTDFSLDPPQFPAQSKRYSFNDSLNGTPPPASSLLDPSMALHSTPINQHPGNRSSATFYGSPNSSLPFPQTPSFTPSMPPPPPPRSVSPAKSLRSDGGGGKSPSRGGSPTRMSPPKNPFNFQSTTFSPVTSTPAKASHRRGHKYKHSSVSINFFQEPPQRAPLPIPESLPIPNSRECYQSMSREQRMRLGWCACHFLVAIMVYNTDLPFTAVKALAHLLIYDAVGATLCVAVDILGNFDVWKQSSLHHPFGLERTEVLAGFALSVALIFMGGDIMSHAFQDLAQSFYGIHHHHEAHIESFSSFIFRVILGIIATIVSAVGLDNHTRISRTMRHQSAPGGSSLSAILSNPSHFMTVSFSLTLLLFPALGPQGYVFIDTLLTPVIAGSMCYVGWTIAKVLGGMLVMSYSGPDFIEEIEQELKQEPMVTSVSNVSFWQVHHELWLCCMNIVMTGAEEDEYHVRSRATNIVKDVMLNKEDGLVATQMSSDISGRGNVRWETTIDVNRTTMQ